MSVKMNEYVEDAAEALGLTVAANKPPLIESMTDNLSIKKMDASEISDGSGKVIVFVTVADGGVDVVRPVADTNGSVKLFANGTALVALAKKAQLAAGANVRFVRFNKVGSVGNPINSLKAKYKKAKVENITAAAKVVTKQSEKSAAMSQGWDTAIGSPEHEEYLDIVDCLGALTEWADATLAMKTTYATALTAAGIDPATVV